MDLLIELALERDNDSHMEKFLEKHFGRGGTPTPERGEGKGPKNATNPNQGGGKGRGNLRAMNEVKAEAGTPRLFYCKDCYGDGRGGGKGGTPNPQRRSSAPATTPSPAEGDPKKRPQGDNASPEGKTSKKRRLAWMAKSLMAAGVDVKFPTEE